MAHPVSILPTLATKADLQAAIAPLATRDEMHTAIAVAIAPLATKAELQAEGEQGRSFTRTLFEELRDQIGKLAEGQVVIRDEVAGIRQMLEAPIVATLSDHETRLLRLEAKRRR